MNCEHGWIRSITWSLILSFSVTNVPSVSYADGSAQNALGETDTSQSLILNDYVSNLYPWLAHLSSSKLYLPPDQKTPQFMPTKDGGIQVAFYDFEPGQTDPQKGHIEIIYPETGTTKWIFFYNDANGKKIPYGQALVFNIPHTAAPSATGPDAQTRRPAASASQSVATPNSEGAPSATAPAPTGAIAPTGTTSAAAPHGVTPPLVVTAPTGTAANIVAPTGTAGSGVASGGESVPNPPSNPPTQTSQNTPGAKTPPVVQGAPLANGSQLVAGTAGAPPTTQAGSATGTPPTAQAGSATGTPPNTPAQASQTPAGSPPLACPAAVAAGTPCAQSRSQAGRGGMILNNDDAPGAGGAPNDADADAGNGSNRHHYRDDDRDEGSWNHLSIPVASYWSANPANSCHQFIAWIHERHESEHMYLAEYKSENTHWSNLDPKLKDFLEISAAAATGAVIGLVAGPIGSLIGAIGGVIGGTVAVLAGFFGHRHKDRNEDGESRREHEEWVRRNSLARRDRVKCIESYLDENNAYADSSRDSRYVTSNSYSDRYQETSQGTDQYNTAPVQPLPAHANGTSCH